MRSSPPTDIGFSPDVYLWIPVLGNITSLLRFLSPATSRTGSVGGPQVIAGTLGAGLLSFAYRYAISIKSVSLVVVTSVLMWGNTIAAYTAPETYRTRLNDLDDRNAAPVSKSDYDRLREQAMAA